MEVVLSGIDWDVVVVTGSAAVMGSEVGRTISVGSDDGTTLLGGIVCRDDSGSVVAESVGVLLIERSTDTPASAEVETSACCEELEAIDAALEVEDVESAVLAIEDVESAVLAVEDVESAVLAVEDVESAVLAVEDVESAVLAVEDVESAVLAVEDVESAVLAIEVVESAVLAVEGVGLTAIAWEDVGLTAVACMEGEESSDVTLDLLPIVSLKLALGTLEGEIV